MGEEKLERVLSGSGEGHTGMVSGAIDDGEERAGAAAFWVDGEDCSNFGVVIEQRSSPSVVEKHSASPPCKDQYILPISSGGEALRLTTDAPCKDQYILPISSGGEALRLTTT
jgi:hypothetical protein